MRMRDIISLVEAITPIADLSSVSEEQLKAIAAEFDDPEGGTWEFKPAFPIGAYIHDAGERASWFRQILARETDPESKAYLEGLLTASSFEPIVLWLTVDDDVFVWDGNHRLGAACARGERTNPAIVGAADQE